MAALVAGNGNALGIFFYSALYYFGYAAVVAQVNYFDAFALQNAAHDVDGCVVPVEKGGSGYYSYLMRCGVCHELFLAANMAQKPLLKVKIRAFACNANDC
jgi:hypothetical protein